MKLTSRISLYRFFSPYLCDNSIITDTEMKKILLLGSGELGKEFVISAQRRGNTSLPATLMPGTRHTSGRRMRSVQYAGR